MSSTISRTTAVIAKIVHIASVNEPAASRSSPSRNGPTAEIV
jgi:hypothetical protein